MQITPTSETPAPLTAIILIGISLITCQPSDGPSGTGPTVAEGTPHDVRNSAYVGPLETLLSRGPGGRHIVGMGATYDPTSITARAVNHNMAWRREAAWTAVGKALTPHRVTLADGTTDTIPSFLSWYIEQEIVEIMAEMKARFGEPGPRGFSDDQIAAYLGDHDKALREGPRDFLPMDREALALIGGGIPAHVGMSVPMFSPGFVTHILRHMRELAECEPNDAIDYIKEKSDGLRRSFSPCMTLEFPRNAVMFKPRWVLVDDDEVAMGAFPTGPNTMRQLLGPLQPGEGRLRQMPSYDPAAPADPGNPETPMDPAAKTVRNFFVVADASGTRYALQSLHVVTKEIDEWIWATIWWSPTPHRDLGLDRPTDFSRPLTNYKLCAATTFMELDATPARQRFPDAPELATVLSHAAWPSGPMRTDIGTASWCANPYIEGGIPTETCTGCHQSAGDDRGSESRVRIVNRHLGDFAFPVRRLRSVARELVERDDL